jgi:hypothetical protein
MSVSITSQNPLKYTVTEGGGGQYALDVNGTIDFTYSPTNAVISQSVTDTASNDSSPNPDQGLFASNIEQYGNGSGTIGFSLVVPESSKFQDANGINITFDLKVIESTQTQYDIGSADQIINVVIQPYPQVIDIPAGQTTKVTGVVGPGTTYQFPLMGQATLEVDSPSNFQGTIEGFEPGDTIDLEGTPDFGAAEVGSNLEVITSEGSTESPIIFPLFLPPADIVSVSSDGHGGTKVTTSASGGIAATVTAAGNPALITGTQLTDVENAIKAAIAQYGTHFGGTANLNIQLYVSDLGGDPDPLLAQARTPVFVPTGQTDPKTGNTIYQTAAAWMLNNPGQDPWQAPGNWVDPNVAVTPSNGVKPDIVIYLNSNAAALKQLDLNNDDEPPQGPDHQVLIYNLMMHELGHAFGFDTFRNESGQFDISGKESVFDSHINNQTLNFEAPLNVSLPIAFNDGPHLAFSPAVGSDLMNVGTFLVGQPKLDVSPTDL